MSHTPPRRAPAVPGVVANLEGARVIERPDGFWLQPNSGSRELGPYASLEEAIENHRAEDEGEDELEPGTALSEVEAQLGVSDWIDPDTDSPAEDSVPHIEEH